LNGTSNARRARVGSKSACYQRRRQPSGPTCEIAGCRERIHALGYCRRHYDAARRDEGLSDPEAVGEPSEDEIEAEFTYGPGGQSVFADERERREAWDEYKPRLMERYTSPPYWGLRPAAFWEFEAERPEHVVAYPEDRFEGTVEERADALDEYEMDPIIFLAENGYLVEREIAAIERKADEARPRVGTDSEHFGSDGEDRADRRAVKLWEAVEAALQ
jgi:hypothetical protein